MSHLRQEACPIVDTSCSLDSDEARFEISKKFGDLLSLQSTPYNSCTGFVYAVYLKNIFRDV
jgi:hypothetical protein